MSTKKLFLSLALTIHLVISSVTLFGQYGTYDIAAATGKYSFSYTQAPGNLIPVNPAKTGISYAWEQSVTPLFDGSIAMVAATPSYNITTPLTQTTYFRRKITLTGAIVVYSNILKIEVVSQHWENINYIREHDILVSGQTDWKTIDQLPIGQKLQTTTYMDGLGRPIQKLSKETATPLPGSNQWGDMVQFSKYDTYGREPKQYLPYTTMDQPGKLKATPEAGQAQYYSTAYNETSPFSQLSFDNSPLNRVTNIKSPGTSWAAAAGNSSAFDLNNVEDHVRQFQIGYSPGNLPVSAGEYSPNSLLKTKHTDENGKEVIEYTNSLGQVVLTKTQIDDNPANAYNGWICIYSIYDDFGLLRFRIQPEAVKWLSTNGWSFSGSNGQKVIDEWCFRYEYDEKGRNIVKKAPGAKALNMIYDIRDRPVFLQDGNQAAKTPAEWTVNLYDDLDRLTLTLLYRTNKTRAQLQSDVDNAIVQSTIVLTNPDQPVKDLVVQDRGIEQPPYKAQNSIEFTPGFESTTGDNFTAEIDPNFAPASTVTTVAFNNPIPSGDLNNPSLSTVLKYHFYDDYSFTSVKSFDNNFDNATAYPAGQEVIPIATSKRTMGFSTGSLTRVLGTNTFLSTTAYYDDKGRLIQTQEENIKSGKDITTLQYHFDGRLLSSHSKHTTAGSGYASYGILTKNIFDKIGRITSIQKKYGSNPFKTIAAYTLDDMGRLATKQLSPGYTGSGKNDLESLTYSYNIHNNITGINKDYALKTPGKYTKWGNFFGLYLGYDNREAVFNTGRLDGTVTGLLWNTQGDDAQRKFDYTYDNSGRLTSANYKEKQTPGETWANNKMDFSTTGTTGKITYDLHGNLLNMIQKGVLPGGAAPVNMDNLTYAYAALSNKLIKVTDNSTAGAANGKSGDFADGSNSGDDYVYDDNGNLVVDLNKNALNAAGGKSTPLGTSGIIYNHLDKPETIRITGKGTITIVYDADGNKLQRKFTPEGGTVRTTTYINEFVYQESALSFIHFEEGRIRVMTAVSENNGFDGLALDGNMDLPNGKRGVYDYFIRDYQQNVRMILTEETHYGIHQATMEPERAGNEEPVFGKTGAGNEVAQTRTGKPEAWQSNPSLNASKLSASTHKAGPNVLLKVMAGDQVSATTNYYYKDPVTNSTGNNLSGPIITSLIQSILGSAATGLAKTNTTSISNQLNANTPFLNKTAPDANNPNGNNPKAYLTIVFFNERFEFVSEGSTSLRVTQSGNNASPLVIPNVKAPKNGYAYVYLSNESNEPVYFDDFKVTDTRGRIIEENHYYAFGLRIAGISSAKFGEADFEGSLKNEYLYNDKELWSDADLNWYDYGFRNYDPQVGRFPQLDPLTWDYPYYTPYQYAGNEPIANVDLDGLEPLNSVVNSAVGQAVVTKSSFLSEIVIKGASKAAPAVAKASTVTTRIFGGLKAVGGILEAGVGIAGGIATGWTGFGAIGGGLVAAHGLDVAASGLNQLIFGTETKSFTEQRISKGLQVSGMSEAGANQWAGNIDGGISIVGSGLAGGGLLKGASVGGGAVAAKTSTNIKYLGRMEDLKGIPRSQTILDDLPNLGSPKANYYQNMSVIRRNLREGVKFKDASRFRPNSELAPTITWPTRTVGQTFYGAERNLMQNRGLWP